MNIFLSLKHSEEEHYKAVEGSEGLSEYTHFMLALTVTKTNTFLTKRFVITKLNNSNRFNFNSDFRKSFFKSWNSFQTTFKLSLISEI